MELRKYNIQDIRDAVRGDNEHMNVDKKVEARYYRKKGMSDYLAGKKSIDRYSRKHKSEVSEKRRELGKHFSKENSLKRAM